MSYYDQLKIDVEEYKKKIETIEKIKLPKIIEHLRFISSQKQNDWDLKKFYLACDNYVHDYKIMNDFIQKKNEAEQLIIAIDEAVEEVNKDQKNIKELKKKLKQQIAELDKLV